LEECVGKLEKKELEPIETEIVPISKAADVFRKMAQGQHQGKIVFDASSVLFPSTLTHCLSLSLFFIN
jgi:hypothetical protein